MPAAAAVLLESEARARATARLRARRNGHPPDEHEPPPPRLPPIAAAEVAATLERALRLSRGPAGAFLMGCNSAVDIGVLRDPRAVVATTVHSGHRKTLHEFFAPARLANMHVPFLNLGPINIGLAVGRVELERRSEGSGRGFVEGKDCGGGGGDDGGGGGGGDRAGGPVCDSPPENGCAMADPSLKSRLMVMGRYARDEQTGEMLTILRDMRPDGDLVSLLWLGPTLGDFVRDRLDIVCDASLFSSGRIADSVLRCERTVRVGGGTPAGLLPEGPLDMRHCRSNLGHLGGSTQDFVMGLPAFHEQLDISDLSVRDHLMSIAVQSRVATFTPGALGVEAGVTLYKAALDVSMLRLNEMKISAGEGVAPQIDIAQSASDVTQRNASQNPFGGSQMMTSALGRASAQMNSVQSVGENMVRVEADDPLPSHASVLTSEDLSEPMEDVDLGQDDDDFHSSVYRNGLADTAFLPGSVVGGTDGMRGSCASNDSPWLLSDSRTEEIGGRENGESLSEFLEIPSKLPNVGTVKQTSTYSSRQDGADNVVPLKHCRTMPRASVPTACIPGSSSLLPSVEGKDSGNAVASIAESAARDNGRSLADDRARAKFGALSDNQVIPTVDESARKKAIRRQKNIEAARRSNQRRKRAYDDLVHVVELARKTESKLRERQSELVIENAALRLLIDRAEGRWKP